MRRALRASSTGRRSRGGRRRRRCRRRRAGDVTEHLVRTGFALFAGLAAPCRAAPTLEPASAITASAATANRRRDPVIGQQMLRRDPPMLVPTETCERRFRRRSSLQDPMSTGYVGILSVELHFPEAGSLKGKRKELLSVKAQLQRRFGASVAEVDHHELWQRARLALSCVARTHRRRRRPARRGRAVPGGTGVRAGPSRTGGGHA